MVGENFEKLSRKLYKDILKNGDVNIRKYMEKGAIAELVLECWFKELPEKDLPNNILFYLLEESNLDIITQTNDCIFLGEILKRFAFERSEDDIYNLINRTSKKPFILEELSSIYQSIEHKDIEQSQKLVNVMKTLVAEGMVTTPTVLFNVVRHCSKIPAGAKNYENKEKLMDLSYDMCEFLIKEGVDPSICPEYMIKKSKAGSLRGFDAPVVEDDSKSINFIFKVCKLLMKNGADLKGFKDWRGNETVLDSICTRDDTKALRNKLMRFYSELINGKNSQSKKSGAKASGSVAD